MTAALSTVRCRGGVKLGQRAHTSNTRRCLELTQSLGRLPASKGTASHALQNRTLSQDSMIGRRGGKQEGKRGRERKGDLTACSCPLGRP